MQAEGVSLRDVSSLSPKRRAEREPKMEKESEQMKWQWLGKSWYAIIFSIGFILLGILYIREYVNNIGKYGVQIMLIGGSVLIIAGFIQLVYAVVHKLLRIYTQREGDRIARAFHSKQKIYPTIICPSCKKKIAEDYSQCPWCGTELKLHEDEISDTHK